MGFILSDVRVRLRSLLKSQGFAAVTILTLAVAIGANTAIYSVVDAVLLRPLPYPDPDALVTVALDVDGGTISELPFSDRGYWHFAESNRVFESFGGYTQAQWPLASEGEPVQITVGVMSRSAFQAIGVSPAIGRFPSEEEDAPGGPLVALLSQRLWAGRFGADPNVLGTTIDLNGNTFEVIGVMPDGYAFPSPAVDAWVAYRLNPASENFGGHHIGGIARLDEGQTIATAEQDAASLISRFEEAGYGPEWLTNVFTGQANIQTLRASIIGDSRQPLLIIFGTVAFVLLIACSNVANLLLVRAEGRARETAVRTALGAGRWRLIQSVLVESIVLAVAGGVLGLILAFAGTRLLVAAGPAAIPRLDEIGIDGGVLLFTSVVSIGAGLIFGVFPAFRVWSRNSNEALRDGGRGSTIGRDRHRARSVLVITQVALALVLLVGSGLMLRSFQQLRAVDPGFGTEGIITFSLAPAPSRFPDGVEGTARFYQDLIDRLETIPGVTSVGAINVLPLSGGGPVLTTRFEEFPLGPGEFPPAYAVRRVTPGYFEAMGIPLVEGRTFEPRDNEQRLGSVIISQSLKDEYWSDTSAIGKRLAPSTAMAEVVGVVGDIRDGGLDSPVEPIIYLPMLDSVGGGVLAMNVAVRTTLPAASVLPTIRREVTSLDPTLPLAHVRTMDAVVSDSMSRTTFTMTLLAIAALVALFLGSVGIYGVISYVVTQRTFEMGVRQALGAAPARIRGLIMRQGLGLAGLGVLIGLAAAALMGRFLASLLYGISPFDPVTFVGGALVFVAVAALASSLPAMRAARIQPATALREE